jgi:hypothetical protein
MVREEEQARIDQNNNRDRSTQESKMAWLLYISEARTHAAYVLELDTGMQRSSSARSDQPRSSHSYRLINSRQHEKEEQTG